MGGSTATTATLCLLAFNIVTCALCSPAYLEFRILDGYDVTIEDHPFQLSLEGGGRHICGASILSPYYALTAAHCVYNQPVRWLALRSGSTLRETGGTVHPAKYYVYHENYRRATMDYDVAIVYVRVPFDLFKSNLEHIKLPTAAPHGDVPTIALGWGYLDKHQLKKPKELQATKLNTLDWDLCKLLYPQITPRMMCAGDFSTDVCTGDSGGPLIRGFREQIGIVSWGYKCGEKPASVYTNVSAVSSWIKKAAKLYDDIVFPN